MRIEVRGDIDVHMSDGIGVYLPAGRLIDPDHKELRFWAGDPDHRPEAGFWSHLRIKAGDLRVFESVLPLLELDGGETVLEIGGGHGWASCMVKSLHPGCEVHASDLSPAAIAGAARWERAFETRLDGRWAFLANATPFADAQFDRVFMFQAFHHVGIGDRMTAVLDELKRILRPGGLIAFLSEPSAPGWLYARQHRHINAIRRAQGADVDEDVVVVARVRRAAERRGLRFEHSHDVSWHYREMSLPGILRNAALARLPFLERLVPCGVHIRLRG